MKKIGTLVLLSLGVFLFASCEKEPDLTKLDGKNTVITDYKKDGNFKQQKYYVNDSILVLGANTSGTQDFYFWVKGKDIQADQLISKVNENMTARGYQTMADKDPGAGLAIHLTYIQNIYSYITYVAYWWDWYWMDWYYPYYPYYPYPIVYSYETGSLVMDMLDLTAATISTKDGEVKPIIWNAYMTGLLTGNNQYDGNKTLEAIDIAFDQSPTVSYK